MITTLLFCCVSCETEFEPRRFTRIGGLVCPLCKFLHTPAEVDAQLEDRREKEIHDE
jgi:hypothetical protein